MPSSHESGISKATFDGAATFSKAKMVRPSTATGCGRLKTEPLVKAGYLCARVSNPRLGAGTADFQKFLLA